MIDDIDRMVIATLDQISNCIDALQSGTAQIPAHGPTLNMSRVHRIWPVIATASPLSQNEHLWAHIRQQSRGKLAQPKVQPLALIEMEDLEALCGMIEAGHQLPAILESKTREPFDELELAVWVARGADAPAQEQTPSAGTDAQRRKTLEPQWSKHGSRARKQAMEAINFAAGIQPE